MTSCAGPPGTSRQPAGAVGPSDYVRGARGNYETVRGLCEGCPVREDCFEAALADDSLVGLWGGTTEAERREIRRGAVA